MDKQEDDPLAITDEYRKTFREKELKREDKQEDDPLAITDEYRKAFREKELKRELNDGTAISSVFPLESKVEQTEVQEMRQINQVTDPLAVDDVLKGANHQNSLQKLVDEAFQGWNNPKTSPVKISNELLERFGKQLLNDQPFKGENKEKKLEINQVTDPLAVGDVSKEASHRSLLQKLVKEEFEKLNNPTSDPLDVSNELVERFGKQLLNDQLNKENKTKLELSSDGSNGTTIRSVFLSESKVEQTVVQETQQINQVTDPLAVDDVLKGANHQNSLQKLVDEAFEGWNNPKTSPVKISNELLERFGKQLLNDQPFKGENKEKKLENDPVPDLPASGIQDIVERESGKIQFAQTRETLMEDDDDGNGSQEVQFAETETEEEDNIQDNALANSLPCVERNYESLIQQVVQKAAMEDERFTCLESSHSFRQSILKQPQEIQLTESVNANITEGELIKDSQAPTDCERGEDKGIEREETCSEVTKTRRESNSKIIWPCGMARERVIKLTGSGISPKPAAKHVLELTFPLTGSPINNNVLETVEFDMVFEKISPMAKKTQASSRRLRSFTRLLIPEDGGNAIQRTPAAGSPVNSNAPETTVLDVVNENISLKTGKTEMNPTAGPPVNDNDIEADECNILYENISSKTEKTLKFSASSEGKRNGKDDVANGSLMKRRNHPSPEFDADEEIDSFNDCVFKCGKCRRVVSQSEFSTLRTNFRSKCEFGRCVECYDWVTKICLDVKERRATRNDERRFECKICLKKFKEKGTLTKHKRIHGEKNFECDICFKKFSQKSNLKSHKFVHSKEKPVKCSMCPKSFPYKNTLIAHLRTHTGDRPYKCDICPKSFNTKSQMSRHKLVHSNNYVTCDTCLKKFNDKNVLIRHIVAIHTREFRYKCATCGKGFIKPHLLKDHVRVHTGQRIFVCDVCGKSFFTEFILNTHMRVHSEERPFTCDICSKSYKTKLSLRAHISNHYDVKNYQCDKCSKFFSRSSNLRDHMLHHTEERHFKCDICNKAFKFKHHLGNHMHTHSNLKLKWKKEVKVGKKSQDMAELCS